ncbi:hypothetical protein [Methylomonas koyamae]|uniref:hypothetical protein n=1 Tax=Methylomonas koyamae TaxID=702114 RepID=UPI002873B140|nr:hypothetical protein [Methylomonas koyamae]WNB74853.1 hypothetical protein RI210_16410 [Methylomonas koyamae]
MAKFLGVQQDGLKAAKMLDLIAKSLAKIGVYFAFRAPLPFAAVLCENSRSFGGSRGNFWGNPKNRNLQKPEKTLLAEVFAVVVATNMRE